MAYDSAYHRNPDSNAFQDLGGQLIAGLGHPLAGGLVLDAMMRHETVRVDFTDGGPPDEQRNHELTVAPSGHEVTNTIATGDLRYWGISPNLEHYFRMRLRE